MKKGHKDALELSKLLIAHDTSWKYTHKPSAEPTPEIVPVTRPSDMHIGPSAEPTPEIIPISDDVPISDADSKETSTLGSSRKSSSEEKNMGTMTESSNHYQPEYHHIEIKIQNDSDEAPLFFAAREGCIEIVEETLKRYPQAIYYLNHNRENLLHVVIKNRNKEIFDYVEKNVPYLRGPLRAVDNKNNSILHMVGCPRDDNHPDTKMKSPVLQLSDDLLLLETLKDQCPDYLNYHRNNEMMTADELFAKNNEERRNEAKEWLRKTAEHSTVVIILIATVAFAAAYTVPGGPDEKTGYPVLLRQPLFLVFAVTDVLSLGFALTAVVVFLSIITSSYQLNDFRRSLPHKLFLGFTLLFFSVTMMMVAFAATIILMVNNRARWTKIALYVVAFFPICIFMLSYIPLYIRLGETLRDWFKKVRKFLPHRASETKKWLKNTAEHSTVVIIFNATVAFAAAYAVPGSRSTNRIRAPP